ncbi:methyl-accepting chemotaxis protein [Nocardioides sp. GY 10127]|uniref:methyl-accepting chemotaxis protein n=1 Tax=Nocardioides sp. GY 10127 TaxID=2569762 RepID=UPI0010A8EBDB|nr:methyl-accepting chemotaxis protein [Nocardioides sp. GY 10127]TIC83948.1 methyl-accepting chemotaxis protein [Nocardioides sp. GY 10127]
MSVIVTSPHAATATPTVPAVPTEGTHRLAGRLTSVVADLSVRARILGIVAVVALVVASLGAFSFRALGVEAASARTLQDASTATRAALVADMMHDSIRGDVLQVLANPGNASVFASATADLEEHSAELTAQLDAVVALGLGTGVDQAVAQTRPVAESYLAAATTFMDSAERSPVGAATAWPGFMTSFKELEAAMPAVADAVQAYADDVAAQVEAEQAMRWQVLGGVAFGLALVTVLGLLLARSISGPLAGVLHVVEGLAEGDLTRTAGLTRRDEIGRMATQLDVATARLRSTVSDLASSAEDLSAAAGDLTAVSVQMSASAQSSEESAREVASTAVRMSQDMEVASAATEEMTSGIGDISQQTASAVSIAEQAVGVAGETTAMVSRLGTSSAEIQGVVNLISGIADQTNLLALNATIEAARAGDAGKGFAVVAGEVKDLANQTSSATGDIAQRVTAIQADTGGAVDAIDRIGSIIGEVSGTQQSIASAMEMQRATSTEISRYISEAASGSSRIAGTAEQVARLAADTTEAAGVTRASADRLTDSSQRLRGLVAGFRF